MRHHWLPQNDSNVDSSDNGLKEVFKLAGMESTQACTRTPFDVFFNESWVNLKQEFEDTVECSPNMVVHEHAKFTRTKYTSLSDDDHKIWEGKAKAEKTKAQEALLELRQKVPQSAFDQQVHECRRWFMKLIKAASDYLGVNAHVIIHGLMPKGELGVEW